MLSTMGTVMAMASIVLSTMAFLYGTAHWADRKFPPGDTINAAKTPDGVSLVPRGVALRIFIFIYPIIEVFIIIITMVNGLNYTKRLLITSICVSVFVATIHLLNLWGCYKYLRDEFPTNIDGL